MWGGACSLVLWGLFGKILYRKLHPVVGWGYHCAILGTCQLSMIHSSWLLNHSSYIFEAPSFGAAVLLLEEAKTPILGEFGMAYNQEWHGNACIKIRQHSPGKILRDKTILVLPQTAVCVVHQVCLTKVVCKKWWSILITELAPFPVLTVLSIR